MTQAAVHCPVDSDRKQIPEEQASVVVTWPLANDSRSRESPSTGSSTVGSVGIGRW